MRVEISIRGFIDTYRPTLALLNHVIATCMICGCLRTGHVSDSDNTTNTQRANVEYSKIVILHSQSGRSRQVVAQDRLSTRQSNMLNKKIFFLHLAKNCFYSMHYV